MDKCHAFSSVWEFDFGYALPFYYPAMSVSCVAALFAKIAISFAAMNARLIPLWVAKEEGSFAKTILMPSPSLFAERLY